MRGTNLFSSLTQPSASESEILPLHKYPVFMTKGIPHSVGPAGEKQHRTQRRILKTLHYNFYNFTSFQLLLWLENQKVVNPKTYFKEETLSDIHLYA